MLLPAMQSRVTWLLGSALLLPQAFPASSASKRAAALPQCTEVHLSAAYLAQADAAGRPGFLLRITNDTLTPVVIAKPFPTSAHWYARNGAGRWSWRASTGSGGALVDAMREHGPVVAYPSQAGEGGQQLLQVPPHGSLEVATSMADNPMLRFRPGCERCRNPGENTYQAVLAYARLPEPGAEISHLLSCGLRSNMVIMPPLP